MYKLFLTWRYLTRRLLSLVAVFILMLAVAVLVVAPSIMSGFQSEFHKRLRGNLSDLVYYGSIPYSVADDERIKTTIESYPNVVAAAPYLENPAIDKHLKKVDYVFLRGIVPEQEERVTELRSKFISEAEKYRLLNDYRLQKPERKAEIDEICELMEDTPNIERIYRELMGGHPDEPEVSTCVVGIYYLKRWKLDIGDHARLTTASDEGEVEQDREFRIVGVYRSGQHEFDRRVIVMSLASMQEFVKVPGRVTGWSVKLKDFNKAEQTKQRMIEEIRYGSLRKIALRDEATGFFIQTWEERNENLLKAVAMERLLIKMMTVLIVLAASASIFLVLFMTVHSKVRELGILRAIGASKLGVLSLFVGQGFLIAFVAMSLGLLLGWGFATNINEFAAFQFQFTGWHPFPPEVYHLDRIPVQFSLKDNLWNFVITLSIGSGAAIIPGGMAALKPPLKAIRYD
ncbi:MAG: ABC transporter permease [Planctomycetes bacterium]|nr:ABC transporter permease [Planctomycetota bacterium]